MSGSGFMTVEDNEGGFRGEDMASGLGLFVE